MGHTISGAGAFFGGATAAAISKIAKSKSNDGGGSPPRGGPPPNGPPPSGGGGGRAASVGPQGRPPSDFPVKSPAPQAAPARRFFADRTAAEREKIAAVKKSIHRIWKESKARVAPKEPKNR